MRRLTMLLAVVALLTAGTVAAQDGDAILGLWATDPEGGGGEAHVDVTKVDGKYFGTIVWLAEPLAPPDDERQPPGTPKTDVNNPDPALRDKPVIGLQIVKDFVYKGDGEWHKGTIYDPDNGKTYKCKIRFGDTREVLKVRGYIGISMIGRTTVWTRVEDGR
ncbi:MAG: DUF2147 domain-containing protein [Thermoanaerobaculales bacterium]|jgi:uncharacterized protein (DUF2147 family)|nr:DUF2147 domain-containing protein [Thermoanaerobaculales bacterium]